MNTFLLLFYGYFIPSSHLFICDNKNHSTLDKLETTQTCLSNIRMNAWDPKNKSGTILGLSPKLEMFFSHDMLELGETPNIVAKYYPSGEPKYVILIN